jgi:hypothetical protein
VEALQTKVKQLEAELEIAKQTAAVRGILMEMERLKGKAANKKKKPPSGKS